MSIRIASWTQARNIMQSTSPLDRDGNLKKDWIALFQEFSNRLVIRSDEIVQEGNRHPSTGSTERSVALPQLLPDDLRRKIGFENACRLYRLKK